MRAVCRALLILTLASVLVAAGCDDDTPYGFGIETFLHTSPITVAPFSPDLHGAWVRDVSIDGQPVPAGDAYFLTRYSGGHRTYLTNGRSPAEWSVRVYEPSHIPCGGQLAVGRVFPRKYTPFYCGNLGWGRGYTSSPAVLQENATNTVTITGPGINDTFGMPKVVIYNYMGNLVGETVATSCGPSLDPEGEPWMTGTVWIPNLAPGDYTFIACDAVQGGGYQDIGGGYLYIVADPPPGCSDTDRQACYDRNGLWYEADCYCSH